MSTTSPEDNEDSKRGAYSYMELLSEWALVNTDASWKQWAACQGADPELFFPDGGDIKLSHAKAKEFCSDCIVYKDCLKFAMDNGITYGVWGGLTPIERQRSV